MYEELEESDATNFLFIYENVVMGGDSVAEKAGYILCHVAGAVFHIYYDSYSPGGNLIEKAGD